MKGHQSRPKLHHRIQRILLANYGLRFYGVCKEPKGCQFHANFIHQPPKLLHPIVAS